MNIGLGHAGAVLEPRNHVTEIIPADLAAECVGEERPAAPACG
jgi:hypothetical protein